jgi:hypothetical protein
MRTYRSANKFCRSLIDARKERYNDSAEKDKLIVIQEIMELNEERGGFYHYLIDTRKERYNDDRWNIDKRIVIRKTIQLVMIMEAQLKR